jgi:hypothetical protein
MTVHDATLAYLETSGDHEKLGQIRRQLRAFQIWCQPHAPDHTFESRVRMK